MDARAFEYGKQALAEPDEARYRGTVRRLAVALVSLTLLALIAAGTASSGASGLRGRVMLSTARPVCREDQPCTKPAAGVLLVFRRNGRAAAGVTTGRDGSYRVALTPGVYTVVAPRYRAGTGITPRTVRVPKGRVARIDFELDTGRQ